MNNTWQLADMKYLEMWRPQCIQLFVVLGFNNSRTNVQIFLKFLWGQGLTKKKWINFGKDWDYILYTNKSQISRNTPGGYLHSISAF